MDSVKIHHYLTSAGTDPYQRWLGELKDLRGRVTIQRRIDRAANGTSVITGSVGTESGSQESTSARATVWARGRDSRSFAFWWIKTYPIADIKEAVRFWFDYQRRKK
jgi:hypothetical protein